ncbi:DUF3114 domain-containing protein [Limosilactobacillus fastidiosus]|uniref:DUF3114 domain-containing protein n=1 Tax=Limosilactobacillus fastidiosus TaxID=2759855 RepID=A0A7W3U061_9LACO|nr:DUF3114 domain-containing protein [Limosilactobacillus fastidiosus]MBB1062987.1 DUF3114 domain-containing protein [Limosilactobacillus fastidiosus]MBB1086230.1 DUF3114 domain-containing protein [Limosilactobacillus fastidiosus]MCD7084536.1 DUF3114 domain-containing protein [Limosilactobacillus fastidiosus]MCD7086497.1 DUF3114 domain-containing protein [Limosilactobacillus fastidiosus]MCD7114938.1 DUF3114 domain-containing protein [Limosilactobacillus fastidiosus]
MNEKVKQLIEILNTNLPPKQRLQRVINDEFHAEFDQYGFLQIGPAYLDLEIIPVSPFFAAFRQLVIDAYQTPKGLKEDELGRKLHLFRSYLDLFYLNYIRQYPGKTDFQRLLNFAQEHRLRLDYETDSGYHNRIQNQYRYPKNMKIQLTRNSWRLHHNPARMIEFIINIDNEEFVSEWNTYKLTETGRIDSDPTNYSVKELEAVANTESFNYGIPHGNYFVYPRFQKTHRYLDVQQPRDNALRQRAKKLYRAPKSYRVGGKFTDLIRAGKIKDVKAWQRIPRNYREKIYGSFIAHLAQSGTANWGINYYLGSTMRYQKYCVES